MVYNQSGVTATQPGMNSIFYYADLDQEQAYWVSIDLDLDEFTEQFSRQDLLQITFSI